MSQLSPRDLEVLRFERQWWKHAGARERAIRETFALSPTRYYQIVNALIDCPAAAEHDPLLVARLRRKRDRRQAGKSERLDGVG